MNSTGPETMGDLAYTQKHAGAWPFVTLRYYRHAGRSLLWLARDHRKGLFRDRRALESHTVPIWQSVRYNWIMGLVFAIGSSFFMLGCAMAFSPSLVRGLPGWMTNAIFFAGSIPFSTAGYLQLFQAANADEKYTSGASYPTLFGWDPQNPGWISASTQFLGTIAFNINTLDALIFPTGWARQEITVWVPGMIGSVQFLGSAYLAYIETAHRHFARPRLELSWWIVAINLLGCLAFMSASTLAYIPQNNWPEWVLNLSNVNLFLVHFAFSLLQCSPCLRPKTQNDVMLCFIMENRAPGKARG